jgi:hypothetical protein
MKKTLVAVLCIAVLVINAGAVLAVTQSYTAQRSLTKMATVFNVPQVRAPVGCNVKITVSPAETNFLGQARAECARNNRWNALCQKKCEDQVRLMLRGTSIGRETGAFSGYNCKMISTGDLAKSSASSCSIDAANFCSRENYNNEYCRKKCVQLATNFCRRKI